MRKGEGRFCRGNVVDKWVSHARPQTRMSVLPLGGGTPFGVAVVGVWLTHRFPLVTGGWEEGARWAQCRSGGGWQIRGGSAIVETMGMIDDIGFDCVYGACLRRAIGLG
jgi:hypothetical protein